VAYVWAWLELALFFPVAHLSLAPFSCRAAPGGAYLDAAPYLRCGSARVRRLQALGGVSLALYVLPVLAFSWSFLRRLRRGSCGGVAPGPVRMSRLRDPTTAVASAAAAGHDDLAAPLMDGEEREMSHSDAQLPVSSVGSREPALDADLGPFERVAHSILLAAVRDPATLWWWPVAHDLGMKLALAAVLGLVPVTSPLLPAAVFLVVAVAVVAHMSVRPWRSAADNALETLVLVAALGVYLLNIMVGSASVTQGHVSESTRQLTRALVSVAYVTVVVSLVAVVVRRRRRKGSFVDPMVLNL
jgi:hypothetical protein